ncbi:MAG: IS1380 family transposase [Gemmatimonadetes bacterium]|nr:IS1380 family transposase [Gemmatimonadota bacterium]
MRDGLSASRCCCYHAAPPTAPRTTAMTQCIERVSVGRTGRRVIVSTCDGGKLVSDGGATLLGIADRDLELTARIAACFPDHRAPSRVTHSMLALVRQRVFAIAAGYEDLNDHLALRDDAMLRLLVGRAPEDHALACPATLCRFENRSGSVGLLRVMDVLIDTFIESFSRTTPSEPLILDIDATADPAHGNQERNFFNGFYDGHCFLPLFIFCGDRLLFSWLRPSSRSAAYNARAAIATVVNRLRERWPDVEIIVRGDAGFSTPRILDWCDENDVGYVIGYSKNSKLNQRIAGHLERARGMSEARGEAARVYTSFYDQARSWPWKRRIVAKAEWIGDRANPRYVVTNIRGQAREIYEDRYCARGDMENRIKEQQYGLFSDRTSCHAFRANQIRLALSAVAYTLIEHVRRIGLKGTQMERAQTWIIRERLFKVAARVLLSVRRVRLQLSETWPHAGTLNAALANLLRRAHGPPDWSLA